MDTINVTRGDALTALHRLNGAHKVSVPSPFLDVPRSAYCADAVDWASFHGIAVGTEEDKFSPDDEITKEALAHMICRYAVATGVKADSAEKWAEDNLTSEKVTAAELDSVLQRYARHSFEYVFADVMEQMADVSEAILDESLATKERSPGYALCNWRDGVLLVGLVEAGRFEAVRKYVDAFIESGETPFCTECGVLGYSVCALYEKYGDEKYEKLCHRIMAAIDEYPMDSDGQVKYGGDRSLDAQYVYVDGTGFVTIFLGRYAALFKSERARRLANLQLENYMRRGVDKTGLVAHGYKGESELCGEIGWGRGTGWMMLAVGSVLGYCAEREVSEKCAELVRGTMSYLRDTDNFSWSLGKKDGHTDTSATGFIMWGVLKAKENGDSLPDIGLERIKSVAYSCLSDIKDGVVYGASGECLDWNVYNDKFGHYKWGQASILAFFGMLVKTLKNG